MAKPLLGALYAIPNVPVWFSTPMLVVTSLVTPAY
jgi:hypothetical protein